MIFFPNWSRYVFIIVQPFHPTNRRFRLQKIKTELDRRKQIEEQENKSSSTNITRNGSAGNVRDLIMDTIGGAANGPPINQNGLYNIISNIGIIFGFAAFAYAVKYILLNLSHE